MGPVLLASAVDRSRTEAALVSEQVHVNGMPLCWTLCCLAVENSLIKGADLRPAMLARLFWRLFIEQRCLHRPQKRCIKVALKQAP